MEQRENASHTRHHGFPLRFSAMAPALPYFLHKCSQTHPRFSCTEMTMPSPSVLIIDDEPDILELLEITLNRMNIQTVCAHNVQSAKQALSQ